MCLETTADCLTANDTTFQTPTTLDFFSPPAAAAAAAASLLSFLALFLAYFLASFSALALALLLAILLFDMVKVSKARLLLMERVYSCFLMTKVEVKIKGTAEESFAANWLCFLRKELSFQSQLEAGASCRIAVANTRKTCGSKPYLIGMLSIHLYSKQGTTNQRHQFFGLDRAL